MGSERRSMVIPEKERQQLPYDAGHAIVARALPEADTA